MLGSGSTADATVTAEPVGTSPNTGNAQPDIVDELMNKLIDEVNSGSLGQMDENGLMDQNEVAGVLDDLLNHDCTPDLGRRLLGEYSSCDSVAHELK